MALTRLFPILLLSGCAVQWSPDYTVRKDITGNEYYEVTLGVTYPKKQFMTAEEYEEFRNLPEHQKQKMIEAYEEREKMEEKWKEFISCMLELPPFRSC